MRPQAENLKLEQPFHMKPLVTREGGRGYQGYFDYFEPNGNHAYVVMTVRYYTRYITPIVITLGRVMLSKTYKSFYETMLVVKDTSLLIV